MTRLAFTGALTVLLLSGGRLLLAADADADARAIVAKAVAATGGAAIAKYPAAVVKMKAKVHTEVGEGEMTATAQTRYPDKLRFEMKFNLGATEFEFAQIVDGDKGWAVVNGTPQELDKEMLAEAREQMHAGRVTDLRDLNGPDVKLTPLGESKVDGKPAVGVRVAAKGYREIRLYFDAASHLLVKSETKGKEPMSGVEYNEVRLYSGYKNVNGVQVAHHYAATRDGKPHADVDLTEIRLLDTLPDKTFAKP